MIFPIEKALELASTSPIRITELKLNHQEIQAKNLHQVEGEAVMLFEAPELDHYQLGFTFGLDFSRSEIRLYDTSVGSHGDQRLYISMSDAEQKRYPQYNASDEYIGFDVLDPISTEALMLDNNPHVTDALLKALVEMNPFYSEKPKHYMLNYCTVTSEVEKRAPEIMALNVDLEKLKRLHPETYLNTLLALFTVDCPLEENTVSFEIFVEAESFKLKDEYQIHKEPICIESKMALPLRYEPTSKVIITGDDALGQLYDLHDPTLIADEDLDSVTKYFPIISSDHVTRIANIITYCYLPKAFKWEWKM